MALGLQTGGSSEGFADYVTYDARAGRMFRVDRKQDSSGQWSTDKVDITGSASFVADLENIEVGWVNYSPQGPVRALAKIGQPIPARPQGVDDKGKPAFKQGFNMRLAMPKDQGGGVREFGSSAGCVIEAVDELHNAFCAAPEGKAGKLPVVTIKTTMPVKSGQSTNYKPIFEIKSWTDRPSSLNETKGATASPATNGHASVPPTTGSTQAEPPATNVASQFQASVDAEAFG